MSCANLGKTRDRVVVMHANTRVLPNIRRWQGRQRELREREEKERLEFMDWRACRRGCA
jgi:hypothetical protein